MQRMPNDSEKRRASPHLRRRRVFRHDGARGHGQKGGWAGKTMGGVGGLPPNKSQLSAKRGACGAHHPIVLQCKKPLSTKNRVPAVIRVFLIHLAWFLLPFVAYGIYIHGRRLFFPTQETDERRPLIPPRRMAILAACGLALVAASLFTLALFEGEPTDTRYAPPRYEDGRIVPGQFQ